MEQLPETIVANLAREYLDRFDGCENAGQVKMDALKRLLLATYQAGHDAGFAASALRILRAAYSKVP